MSDFLLYLLEASLVLVLLYAAYRLLLSRETFFSFNRFFLLSVLVLSLLFPLISFEVTGSNENFISEQSAELGKARNTYHLALENWPENPVSSSERQASRWQQFWSGDLGIVQVLVILGVAVYIVGLVYHLVRLCLGYLRVYLLKRRLVSTELDGFKIVQIPSKMAPFSFMNTVFIPGNIEDATEYSQILAHEKVHIQQRHSIDLIFVQLVAACLWFNPVVWLLVKSLKQTHEYIADKSMLMQGFSLVEYQSLLLRQLISNNSYGLVHNFNLSFIKKRIAMMSIKESGWIGKTKAVAALSLTLMIGAFTAQSNTVPEVSEPVKSRVFKDDTLEMKFFIDGVPLRNGLQFSEVKNHEGAFKFVLDNDKDDNIRVGLDLVRKGKVVGNATRRLQENTFFQIKELLRNAELEDYLVIDIIEGPSEAVKLYSFPIFKESEAWKNSQVSDLPPPPVSLFVNSNAVGADKALSLSELSKGNALLEYKLSDFVDFGVLSRQAGGVEIKLVRQKRNVRIIVANEVKRKDSIDLSGLSKVAKKGDRIVIQFGKPDGLSFGSQFLIE